MKKVFALVLVVVLLMTLVGCKKDVEIGIKDKVLTIGVDDTYPPMEFINENTNELEGFDVDFANELGAVLGVKVKFISTGWDGIFLGLTSEKYDCIISSVSMTPERLESYDFSTPYLSNGIVILVAAGNENIGSPADLAGKNVGVQTQTTADTAAEKQNAMTPFSITKYDTVVEAFLDLDIGRTEAIVVDYAVALEYVRREPDKYAITTARLTNEPIAVCFKKGETELTEQINAAIKTLQDNGKLSEISMKWFDKDDTTDIDTELR